MFKNSLNPVYTLPSTCKSVWRFITIHEKKRANTQLAKSIIHSEYVCRWKRGFSTFICEHHLLSLLHGLLHTHNSAKYINHRRNTSVVMVLWHLKERDIHVKSCLFYHHDVIGITGIKFSTNWNWFRLIQMKTVS